MKKMHRTETGKIEFNLTTTNIGEVCQKTCATFATTNAATKNVDIQYSAPQQPTLVRADRSRLEEIMVNLLSAALENAPAKSQIRIWHEIDGGDIITNITRSGPALSQEVRSHLFERFYLSKQDIDYGTTGTILDMYITKELVERMGGKIRFTSK